MTLKQLQFRRKILQEDFHRISNHINDEGISLGKLLIRKQKLEEICCKFDDVQQEIEELVFKKEKEDEESEAMREESETRNEFHTDWENAMEAIQAKIETMKDTEIRHTEKDENPSISTVERLQARVLALQNRGREDKSSHSGKVTFTNYDPDSETIGIFLRRLEIYLTLIGCTDSLSRSLVLLNSLNPKIFGDLCAYMAPLDPKTKTFEELSSNLKKLLLGEGNIYVEQHKFIIRTQEGSETVQQYCVALKNLANTCDFVCECGKRIDETFLKLQFIRGIKDPEIRQKLLQDDPNGTFDNMVKKASTIELSKNESTGMKLTNVEMFSISKEVTRDEREHAFKSKGKRSNRKMKNYEKCFRCGRTNHRASSCFYIEAKCHNCGKIGHLSKCCTGSKSKGIHEIEDSSDNESLECGEINCMRVKSSDKMFITVHVDTVPMEMELDTGAAVSTISDQQFKKLFPSVAYVKVNHRGELFYSKLYVIPNDVSTILGREWLREMNINWSEDVKTIVMNTEGHSLDDLFIDVHPWEMPSGPWQRIHIDFAGPIQGQMILEFEDFMKYHGISHITAPYHPASNGLAERGVQSMKQSLKKMSQDGGTLDSKIQQFLIQYRRSPHATTGVSPFEAMFGRLMRNSLTLMRKDSHKKMEERHVKKKFDVGDQVMYRNYQSGEKWEVGEVVKKIGRLHYLIESSDGFSCKRHVNQMKRSHVTYSEESTVGY
ncbi:hypothetical protein WDU94_007501 [Cyamophila willieti]